MATTTKKQPLAFGGVVFDETGNVLLVEPRGHFDGYVWTFPKGRALKDETPDYAARRHVRQDTGYDAHLVTALPGLHQGGTGYSIYFLMTLSQRDANATRIENRILWASPDEARARIAETLNALGRARDLAVLEAALLLRASLPPKWFNEVEFLHSFPGREAFVRRLLEMVALLHGRGFESLRICPGISQSWRTAFAPAKYFQHDDGAMLETRYGEMPRYSMGDGMGAFDWMAAAALPVEALADRFETTFAAMLKKCRTPDPAYVEWYREMLGATQPLGLPIAYWDMKMEDGYLRTVGHTVCMRLEMPPHPLNPERPGKQD